MDHPTAPEQRLRAARRDMAVPPPAWLLRHAHAAAALRANVARLVVDDSAGDGARRPERAGLRRRARRESARGHAVLPLSVVRPDPVDAVRSLVAPDHEKSRAEPEADCEGLLPASDSAGGVGVSGAAVPGHSRGGPDRRQRLLPPAGRPLVYPLAPAFADCRARCRDRARVRGVGRLLDRGAAGAVSRYPVRPPVFDDLPAVRDDRFVSALADQVSGDARARTHQPDGERDRAVSPGHTRYAAGDQQYGAD